MSSKDDFASHIPPAKLPSSYKEEVNKMRRIMENKITANKMALVRNRLANHEQSRTEFSSHREADKVQNNFDVCKGNEEFERALINNDRDKSCLPVQDNSKVNDVQSEQHVISNGILSLQLENKEGIMNPNPPPSVSLGLTKGMFKSFFKFDLNLEHYWHKIYCSEPKIYLKPFLFL